MNVLYTGLLGKTLIPWGYKFHLFLNNSSRHAAVTEMEPIWSVLGGTSLPCLQKHLNSIYVISKYVNSIHFFEIC